MAKAIKTIKRGVRKLVQLQPKLKFYYGMFYKHAKVHSNRMLMESFHGKNISDSTLAVLEELDASGEARDYQIYYASADVARDKPFVRANNLPVRLVDINSRRYTYILATSKYLLNNSSFPVYFIRRPDQVYVQTWHGTPLKTLGKRMRLGMESMYNVQHNFLQASCLTFPNEFTREAIMRDYNLDDLYTGTVAMVGYPRNSVFMKDADPSIRRECGLDGYETFAYMPTWRGKNNYSVEIESYRSEVESYLERIDAALRDDQKLFVNFHSMVAASISLGEYKHIFPFPETVPGYDFLSQIDCLITDYSSVFFDYALTGKPIVLFAYDLEDYLSDRGFYFPIEDLPFPIVKDVDSLIDCMTSGSYRQRVPERSEFDEAFLNYDSPNNARIVADLLLQRPVEGLITYDYSANREKPWHVFYPEQQRTLADFDSIFKTADPENDLIVLKKSRFAYAQSAFVHDNYRDGFRYLFATNTTPRTYLEEALSRVSEPVRQRLAQREQKRLFADLNIVDQRCDYKVLEVGGSYSDESCAEVTSEVSVEGATVTVDYRADGYDALAVFVTNGRTLIWKRPLGAQERSKHRFSIDVGELLCDFDVDLKRNGRYVLGLELQSRDGANTATGILVEREGNLASEDDLTHYLHPALFDTATCDRSRFEGDFRYEHSVIFAAAGKLVEVTPYYSTTGKLSLYVSLQGEGARAYLNANLRSIQITKDSRVIIKARMKRGDFAITGMAVESREETIDITYPIDYTVQERGEWLMITGVFAPRTLQLDATYWDVVLSIDEGLGYPSSVYVLTSSRFRTLSKVLVTQCDLGEGDIIFPYSAKAKKLAFTRRPRSKADTAFGRAQEFAAYALYMGLHFYWSRKRMWLVYEKYCSLAQDNAYQFFKYCMEEAGPEAKKFVYYVIDKNAPDYANVAKYDSNVVDFMSFKHMLYSMVAKIYVASDSKAHLYQWRPRPSVVRGRIFKHKIFFLQHGVTALKRVDRLFGRSGTSPMTYFLTTSEREQQIVTENFGYTLNTAPILGFSRWDALFDSSNAAAPSILLMPTWRTWLEEQSEEVFLASDYYQAYTSLVRNPKLHEVLERHNATLKFFIHPKLGEYMKLFAGDLPRIEFIELGSRPLNELIMECSALITDYSSVCWDVLYMDKPVVFYQFDQERYKSDIGTYIDFESELPGALCHEEDACIQALDDYANSGFVLTQEDEKRSSAFFTMKDRNNRQRTYGFLVDQGY